MKKYFFKITIILFFIITLFFIINILIISSCSLFQKEKTFKELELYENFCDGIDGYCEKIKDNYFLIVMDNRTKLVYVPDEKLHLAGTDILNNEPDIILDSYYIKYKIIDDKLLLCERILDGSDDYCYINLIPYSETIYKFASENSLYQALNISENPIDWRIIWPEAQKKKYWPDDS